MWPPCLLLHCHCTNVSQLSNHAYSLSLITHNPLLSFLSQSFFLSLLNPWHSQLLQSFLSFVFSFFLSISVRMFGLSLKRQAWSWWETHLSGRQQQCHHCTTMMKWRKKKMKAKTTWKVGWDVGLCSGKVWSTTFRTVHSQRIESHAHLALEGLTIPMTASRPQAQSILTLEAALESLSAGDEELYLNWAGLIITYVSDFVLG